MHTSFEKHASDNVTCVVVCFSEDAPPPRFRAGRTMSRNGLTSLSSALSACDMAPPPLGATLSGQGQGALMSQGSLMGQPSLLIPVQPMKPSLSKVSSEDLAEGE